MSEPEQEQSGFVIDGEAYPIPSFYSLNMDENQIMFDVSGSPTEDWLMMIESARSDDLDDSQTKEIADRLRNPGMLRAAVHIAYRRVHPDTDFADIDVVVGRSNHLENWAALFLGSRKEDETENPPTASPTTSAGSGSELAKPGNDNSNGTPGTDSTTGSAPPDETQPATGTGRSDTSFPLSPHMVSAS